MTQSYSTERISVNSLELTIYRLISCLYRPQRVLRKTEMSELMPLDRTDPLHNEKLRGNNTTIGKLVWKITSCLLCQRAETDTTQCDQTGMVRKCCIFRLPGTILVVLSQHFPFRAPVPCCFYVFHNQRLPRFHHQS